MLYVYISVGIILNLSLCVHVLFCVLVQAYLYYFKYLSLCVHVLFRILVQVYLYYFKYLHVCVHVLFCILVQISMESEESVGSLELELQAGMNHLMQVLETELWWVFYKSSACS